MMVTKKKKFLYCRSMSRETIQKCLSACHKCIAFCEECILVCNVQKQHGFAEQCKIMMRCCQNVVESLKLYDKDNGFVDTRSFHESIIELGKRKRTIKSIKTKKETFLEDLEEGFLEKENFFDKINKCCKAAKYCQELLLFLEDFEKDGKLV